MSGGIDSSVAAMLLKDQGFDIIGVTYRTWDAVSKACMEKESGCCSVDAIFEAKEKANELGFEHHILDLREPFKETVIGDFINEYLRGRTPNPCVLCNSEIKWGELIDFADRYNCDYIATGHYAKVLQQNGRYFLSMGEDQLKDQTYFLWSLSQKDLQRTLFPLGNFTKDRVRQVALEKGFEKLSQKKESQEICFIPDDDYRRFLRDEVPDIDQNIGPGDFIYPDGQFIGKHKGYPFYTIGQRKGLNVAVGYPLYVIDIQPETNTIVLGEKSQLAREEAWIHSCNLMKYESLPDGFSAQARIRYRSKPVTCQIFNHEDRMQLIFEEPVAAITPGQSAVLYEGPDLIGGGFIDAKPM